MRGIKFVLGEYYHIYNRGVDKRNIFSDQKDFDRFWKSILEFNQVNTIGSIYEFSFVKDKDKKPLVEFVAYCINPNHFHFLLRPLKENGIEKFMHKLGLGYTKYFNTKHKRSGVLFEGKFKAKHVNSNEYLLHLSAYININDQLSNQHGNQLGNSVSKSGTESVSKFEFRKSSLLEFLDSNKERDIKNFICNTSIILEQFKNKKEYEIFVKNSLKDIKLRKKMAKELEL